MNDSKAIKDIEKRLSKLESGSGNFGKKTKKTRKPSPYNDFVGNFIPKYKKDNPDASHKKAFSEAVKAWNEKK